MGICDPCFCMKNKKKKAKTHLNLEILHVF